MNTSNSAPTEEQAKPDLSPFPGLPALTFEAAELLVQRFPHTDDFEPLAVDIIEALVLNVGVHETLAMIAGVCNVQARGMRTEEPMAADAQVDIIALRATAFMVSQVVGLFPDPFAPPDEEDEQAVEARST